MVNLTRQVLTRLNGPLCPRPPVRGRPLAQSQRHVPAPAPATNLAWPWGCSSPWQPWCGGHHVPALWGDLESACAPEKGFRTCFPVSDCFQVAGGRLQWC